MPIVDWATHFWRSGPIDGAKELHHAERVARAGEHAGLDRTRGGRRVSRGREPLNGIELLTSLVQMQLVLQAVQRCRVAVGIKLVIQRENKTQRVFRVGESLKVPNALAEERPALDDFEPKIGDIIELRNVGLEIQNFARAQSERRLRRKSAMPLLSPAVRGFGRVSGGRSGDRRIFS